MFWLDDHFLEAEATFFVSSVMPSSFLDFSTGASSVFLLSIFFKDRLYNLLKSEMLRSMLLAFNHLATLLYHPSTYNL